jgi:hypothetical protein
MYLVVTLFWSSLLHLAFGKRMNPESPCLSTEVVVGGGGRQVPFSQEESNYSLSTSPSSVQCTRRAETPNNK